MQLGDAYPRPLLSAKPLLPAAQMQALTVLGGQLQGRGAGLRHGEECVGDVGQEAVEVQELPPTGLLLGAPQQHRHHAGEELPAPLLWRRPPPFHLAKQQSLPVGGTPHLSPVCCLEGQGRP